VRYLGYLKNDERRENVLKLLAEMDEHYLRMTQYLMKKDPVDLMMLVLTSTDSAQHFFWHYMDQNHPHYDPDNAARFGSAIRSVYQRADRIVEKLTEGLPEESTIILMSDHGFRPTSARILYLNKFLQKHGLLKLREQENKWYHPGVLLDHLIKSGDIFLRSSLSPRQKERVAQLFPLLRNKWESHNSGLSNIDWENTRAYCYEMVTCPSGIWINLNGLRPQGIVQPGPEYDSLLQFITEKLYELKDPLTGRQLVIKVYRKDEIYSGPYLDRAPDLTVAWWDGISFVGKPSFSAHRNGNRGKVVEYIGAEPLTSGEWTGNHAVNGILVMKGKHIKEGKRLEGAEIIDVAPTILHLLGVPNSEDMDGRVLIEAFNEGYVASNSFGDQVSGVSGTMNLNDQTYSDTESNQIAQRLRDLGYLE
jgi:predicted AlkP superfamily phosphohydrolase/phosphomutase